MNLRNHKPNPAGENEHDQSEGVNPYGVLIKMSSFAFSIMDLHAPINHVHEDDKASKYEGYKHNRIDES